MSSGHGCIPALSARILFYFTLFIQFLFRLPSSASTAAFSCFKLLPGASVSVKKHGIELSANKQGVRDCPQRSKWRRIRHDIA
jgi:hypothetical protein